MEIRRIFMVLFAIAMPTIAMADCYTSLRQKAIEAYNQGEYDRAKNTFQAAKEDCPDAPLNNDIDSWIQKCESAKKQHQQKTNQGSSSTNSQSSSYLRVDNTTANSTKYLMSTSSSITIRVSCSSAYSVLNIPSWCWITNKTSTSFTLNYQANPNTYTRYGSIDISGGGTSIRISLEQDANTTSPSLNVSKTSISAGASGTTEYITVTCNTTWEVQFPSGGMYDVTRSGNTLTVKVKTNSSTESRSDFFNVKTTDGTKVQKITLSQAGKSSSSGNSYAVIENAWIEHNVYQNNIKGMKVHAKFSAYNSYNHKVGVVLHFVDSDGFGLKDYNNNYSDSNGKVAHSDSDIATYINTTCNDFIVFFPYSELHMTSGCKNITLKVQLGIYDWTSSKWLTDSNAKTISFTFSN